MLDRMDCTAVDNTELDYLYAQAELAKELNEAMEGLLAWSLEKEEGSEYKARIQKPIIFAKVRELRKKVEEIGVGVK